MLQTKRLVRKESRLDERFQRVVIFDIETTGFSQKFHTFSMISFLYLKEGSLYLEQWMIENKEEERSLIILTLQFLKSFDLSVHFNGLSFDIPFMNGRSKNLEIFEEYDKDHSLDLYRECKSQKLKEANTFERMDTLSGKEVADELKRLLKEKDMSMREKILLHNEEDVLQTFELMVEHSDIVGNRLYPKRTLQKATLGKNNLRLRFLDQTTLDIKTFEVEELTFRDRPDFNLLSEEEKKKELVSIAGNILHKNVQEMVKDM
ncbi:ribonuclease H-like domain-containing protein [Guggenheimella bovis]